MSMGRRPTEQQAQLWVPTADLPLSPGHLFYDKLNRLLAETGFDRHVEELCQPHYAQGTGRESIPPGVYFRMLIVGYFEGLDSQRAIAWRCCDSLSLRAFLGIPLSETTPDHSSLTKIRQRLPLEVHEQVFALVLGIAQQKKFLRGKTVAVDATTLEANAAMKSIVRKDSGEDWKELGRAGDSGLVEVQIPPPNPAYLGWDPDPILDGWEIHREVFADLASFPVPDRRCPAPDVPGPGFLLLPPLPEAGGAGPARADDPLHEKPVHDGSDAIHRGQRFGADELGFLVA